jgi:DNA-binding NarL/FixJ family response regulator
MRVLVVDDHPLFSAGLTMLLRELAPSVTVDHAHSVESALDAAARHALNLVLLDLALPGRSGLEALDQWRRHQEDLPVVVISSTEDPEVVRTAIDRGAMGFIPKSSPPAVTLAALRVVLAGGIYLPPNCFIGMPGTQESKSELTPRQAEVLRLILEGKSIKAMSKVLGTSENTTKTHVGAVLRWLGVTTRTQAVVAAHHRGLRFPPR